MEKRRDLGLLPIPPHRRRRLPLFGLLGVLLLAAGWVLEIGFVWGLGVGFLVATAVALILDGLARRRG